MFWLTGTHKKSLFGLIQGQLFITHWHFFIVSNPMNITHLVAVRLSGLLQQDCLQTSWCPECSQKSSFRRDYIKTHLILFVLTFVSNEDRSVQSPAGWYWLTDSKGLRSVTKQTVSQPSHIMCFMPLKWKYLPNHADYCHQSEMKPRKKTHLYQFYQTFYFLCTIYKMKMWNVWKCKEMLPQENSLCEYRNLFSWASMLLEASRKLFPKEPVCLLL